MRDKKDVRFRFSLERLHFSFGFRRSKCFYLVASSPVTILLCSILWASYVNPHHRNPDIYETVAGEERTVAFPDGSSLHLQADTRVAAYTSEAGRTELKLSRGQILIHVAENSQRAYRVDVPGAHIYDVGTQYEISTNGVESTVAVLEGVVEIARDKPLSRLFAEARMPVKQGQQARILSNGQFFLSDTESSPGTIKRRRPAHFSNTPLAEIAEEFNRNNIALRFIVEGDARDIRISADFSLDRPERLLGHLKTEAAIELDVKGKIVTVRKRTR